MNDYVVNVPVLAAIFSLLLAGLLVVGVMSSEYRKIIRQKDRELERAYDRLKELKSMLRGGGN